ncbi:MAG: DUF1579 family protein [Ignavibacteria bacterium]|nr:DUF1579 family protein [Ignavibacteria bacterium]
MKTRRIYWVLLLFLLYSANIFTQSDEDEAMKIAGPAPEHELIKKLEGKWSVEFKYSIGGDAMIGSKGFAEGKMILGNRFLSFEQSVEFAGTNFTSLSIMGYDRRINKYTYYGIDEFGTYAVTGEGKYDNDTKVMTLYGSTLDPSGKTTSMQDYKFVFEFISDAEIKCDVIFIKPDKTETAIVKMTYKK